MKQPNVTLSIGVVSREEIYFGAISRNLPQRCWEVQAEVRRRRLAGGSRTHRHYHDNVIATTFRGSGKVWSRQEDNGERLPVKEKEVLYALNAAISEAALVQ